VAIFAVIHFVYNITQNRKENVQMGDQGEGSKRKIPAASLAVVAVSTLLIFGGSNISSILSSSLKVSSFDVRPGAQITTGLIGEAWKQNAVLGVGPNKFSNL